MRLYFDKTHHKLKRAGGPEFKSQYQKKKERKEKEREKALL
jgi:hypothetical protein